MADTESRCYEVCILVVEGMGFCYFDDDPSLFLSYLIWKCSFSWPGQRSIEVAAFTGNEQPQEDFDHLDGVFDCQLQIYGGRGNISN